jgi:hypothetical protein
MVPPAPPPKPRRLALLPLVSVPQAGITAALASLQARGPQSCLQVLLNDLPLCATAHRRLYALPVDSCLRALLARLGVSTIPPSVT